MNQDEEIELIKKAVMKSIEQSLLNSRFLVPVEDIPTQLLNLFIGLIADQHNVDPIQVEVVEWNADRIEGSNSFRCEGTFRIHNQEFNYGFNYN